MTDILLAGSAGFVGSNICNYLVQHTKYNLASLDDLSTVSNLKNLQASINSKNRHTFYLAEAENSKIINKIFELEKPKPIIYNLASTQFEQIGEWRLQYKDAIKTLNLWLDLAFLHKAEKFIIIMNPLINCQKISVNQNHFLSACSSAVIEFSKKFTINVLKPCNIFGPRQGNKEIIPKIFQSVLKNEKIFGLEDKKKDWIYIKDFFYIVSNFINNDFYSGSYAIKNDEFMSELDIFNLATNIINLKELPKSTYIKDYSLQNSNKFDIEYEWTPQYSLVYALEHTFCWFDINKWAWKINE